MSFSAIIPAVDVAAANAALETAGFGPDNFSAPLWRGDAPDPDSYGLNASGEDPVFRATVEAIPTVSIRASTTGTVEFDQHVAAEGLKRTPSAEPDNTLPDEGG